MKNSSESRKSLKEGDFFERVYSVVRLVPVGRVTTYGAIAAFIGAPGAARMVGWAMNASPKGNRLVPAHRVVNRSGMLTGKHHFRHPEMMKELLESEGVRIEDDKVTDFEQLFWDPYKELI